MLRAKTCGKAAGWNRVWAMGMLNGPQKPPVGTMTLVVTFVLIALKPSGTGVRIRCEWCLPQMNLSWKATPLATPQ